MAELCKSDTAARKGIDNFPTFEVVERLASLAEVLDGLRAAWGSAVRVTSGYRCAELNAAVGGASTSAHLLGWAADLQPVRGTQDDFDAFAVDWLRRTGTKFDQCIRERSGGERWLHLGLYDALGRQRGQIFLLDK